MSESNSISESSGNVFADLALPEPEEALAKAELARRIGGILKSRRWSQAQAATVLGIDQPKVSALLRGKLSGFSTDRLLRFLNALDRDVEIVIKRKPRSRKQAEIRIVVS